MQVMYPYKNFPSDIFTDVSTVQIFQNEGWDKPKIRIYHRDGSERTYDIEVKNSPFELLITDKF